MTHLGEKVTALVDGQLPVEAMERAHAHLANCRDCREAVEAERLMKARLTCLSSTEPGADLVARLLAMGGPSGPLPPRPGHVPGSPRPVPVRVAEHSSSRPLGTRPFASRSFAGRSFGGRTLARAGSRGLDLGGVSLAPPAPGPAAPVSVGLRPSGARPGDATRPASGRPAGRPAWGSDRNRARLAGAVLGALGVVGAGVGGLVLAAPSVSGAPAPNRAPLDSFVVQRPAITQAVLPGRGQTTGLRPPVPSASATAPEPVSTSAVSYLPSPVSRSAR